MEKYILALDEGTTSARALLVDKAGKIIKTSQREFPQYYPEQGWVEQDPLEIWSCQYGVMNDVLLSLGLSMKNVAAIGITNQRETSIIWDRQTGEPVGPAIVWQCRRTADTCEKLKKSPLAPVIQQKTGLMIDAYFSATKIGWMLDNIPGCRRRAEAGDLCFGTVDTWLLWKLTGGKVHATDSSNASRTMLYDIHRGIWDPELLTLFGIPESLLPTIKPSGGLFGLTDPELTGIEIPVTGMLGDQQAALFGQFCHRPGELKNTYGTGCFLLMNTGSKPVISTRGLLGTVAWTYDGRTEYALEGSVFMAGAIIQWLRDDLGLISTAAESEDLALSVEDTAGVTLVPAFQGLGTPWWDMKARGMISGLTRAAGKPHIVRAALEAIAYRTRDLVETMETESGQKISVLKADGGASANNFLLQFQSDILGIEVQRPSSVETTSLGAAYMSGLATGYWKSLEELSEKAMEWTSFLPSIEEGDKERLYDHWKREILRIIN
jgi:glycerol kinase